MNPLRRLPSRVVPLLAALAAPAAAQTVALGDPPMRFPGDFGSIQTVRELPDGRVLVADPLGRALYVVDLDAGERSVVGSEGQGPDEYRQPDAVWPLPGDSTLLVDLGNARLVVLGPDLRFGRTMPISRSDFQPGVPLVLAMPQGIDGSGRIYFRSTAAPGRGAMPDSADVLRLEPDGSVTTVTRFKMEDREVSRSGGGRNESVQVRPVPLSPQDAWGVAPDGSVVVARVGGPRVQWIEPSGRVTTGPVVRYPSVRVGGAEKEAWVAARGRIGGIGISIEAEDGVARMSFARGGAGSEARQIASYPWPETLPPFQPERIAVDGEGRAWVHRQVAAGEPSTYDVFDRDGRRVGTVTLPGARRVLGFGERGMYVVSWDELDLAWLERYPVPL